MAGRTILDPLWEYVLDDYENDDVGTRKSRRKQRQAEEEELSFLDFDFGFFDDDESSSDSDSVRRRWFDNRDERDSRQMSRRRGGREAPRRAVPDN